MYLKQVWYEQCDNCEKIYEPRDVKDAMYDNCDVMYEQNDETVTHCLLKLAM